MTGGRGWRAGGVCGDGREWVVDVECHTAGEHLEGARGLEEKEGRIRGEGGGMQKGRGRREGRIGVRRVGEALRGGVAVAWCGSVRWRVEAVPSAECGGVATWWCGDVVELSSQFMLRVGV